MLSGSILDVHPDYRRNVMVTWLATGKGAVRIEDRFEPTFAVAASSQELSHLAARLQDHPQVKLLDLSAGRLALDTDRTSPLLLVTPRTLQGFHGLATLVDSWGGYHRYRLFNVDLRLPTRYLEERGVFCNAAVRWDGKVFSTDDQAWAIDYPAPPYRSVRLAVNEAATSAVPTFAEPIVSLTVGTETVEEGCEADTLREAAALVHRLDPDLLYTRGGDSVWFPYLAHRASVCGLGGLHLGRDRWDAASDVRPTKQARSYLSYGQVVFRPAFYTLRGRAHIDTASSFLYGESDLYGLIDISRCSNIPLQLLSRLGPGTAISQIQMNAALRAGYPIPWKKNLPEGWKTGRELLHTDRGGLILEPSVGIHDDVWELDFASLYPTIMLLHNISPETVLCPCCPDSTHRVPQLGYHLCQRRQGLLPAVLAPILYRRFCFKARARHPDYDAERYQNLQKAWKWVLLVCFGYTGYRNARFGRIECHESITAFSREALLSAKETAERAGYRVLHGIVDSLWVTPQAPCMRAAQLARQIGQTVGIRMAVEGRYRWIVFLPCADSPVGALTRYYGLFDSGEVKLRGVEARQRDTPAFLKETQQQMLAALAQAHSAGQFAKCIPEALAALAQAGTRLREGNVTLADLVVRSRVTMSVDQYRVNTLVKAALLQLQERGIIVQPGQSVRYVVTNEQAQRSEERVRVVESLTGRERPDSAYYGRKLARCGESLLSPFGFTEESLLPCVLGEDYLRRPGMQAIA